MEYGHVALIGLGLIASSISHAMRRAGMAARITGHARTAATRAEAARLGLCEVCDTAQAAVEGADLVILCVPVGAMAEVTAAIAPHLAAGAPVSDVGSVKQAVIDTVAPHLPKGVAFVPAHPARPRSAPRPRRIRDAGRGGRHRLTGRKLSTQCVDARISQ